MNMVSDLAPGLTDEVHHSQAAFRAVLDALARPGQRRAIGPALPGVDLGGAMARLLLTLTDDETPVWWQHPHPGLQHWLRFHTGAPATLWPGAACFAVFTDTATHLNPNDFAAGSAESPEFSSTLLIELPALAGGLPLAWRGPGIETVQHVALQGLSADFWRQRQEATSAFPQGIDIVFTCGDEAVGLPRTTRVTAWEGA